MYLREIEIGDVQKTSDGEKSVEKEKSAALFKWRTMVCSD